AMLGISTSWYRDLGFCGRIRKVHNRHPAHLLQRLAQISDPHDMAPRYGVPQQLESQGTRRRRLVGEITAKAPMQGQHAANISDIGVVADQDHELVGCGRVTVSRTWFDGPAKRVPYPLQQR